MKPNRKRSVHFHLWATEEEAALIRQRMAEIGVTSLGAYFRKMAIDGFIVKLDLRDVREMVSLLRYTSNNLNQVTKRANATGSIYKTDIEKMQKQLDEIWEMARGILQELSQLK